MSFTTAVTLLDQFRKIAATPWTAASPNSAQEGAQGVTSDSLTRDLTAAEQIEEINHEQIPPRRREVRLIDLVHAGRERKGEISTMLQDVCNPVILYHVVANLVLGNFELVPRLRDVIALDETHHHAARVSGMIDDEQEWEYLNHESQQDGALSRQQFNNTEVIFETKETYADVVKRCST